VTPLLLATLAWAAGLLLGLRAGPEPVLLALIALCAPVPLLLARRGGAALAFCLAGVLVGGLRAAAVRADCRLQIEDGARVQVGGVPATLPAEGVTTPFRAVVRTAAARDAGSARGGDDDAGDVVCAGTVRVRATARFAALLDSAALGLTPPLVGHGRWLAYPVNDGWPRRPEYAGGVLLDSVSPSRLALPASPRAHAATRAADLPRVGPAARLRAAQQSRIRALLPARWPLAEAVLLAQRAGLAPETRTRWVAAGLVHLLAISGMHVGLIVGGMLLLGRAARLPPRATRRLAITLTAAYVLFLGAPTAALRALLQAALLLGAVELQRPAEPFTALAAAALAILLVEPLAILDPGFQLSFAGMIGLIGWRRPVAALLSTRLPSHLRDGIAAGIAASALTTPIAALHFGTVAWIGIPASVVAVPLLALAIAALLVALLVATLTGAVTGVHALAADAPLRALDATASLAAAVPGGHGYAAASSVLAVLAAIAVAILIRRALAGAAPLPPPPSHAARAEYERWLTRRRTARLRLAAAAAAALVVLAWAPLLFRPHDGRVEIHAIDVGQGDAFAIRTPANRWILVDAGPRTPRFDAGRDRVVPYLLRHGARRLEALILTHPDADHIGGAAAVLDAFDVGTVIDPGFPAGKDMFIDLLAAARRTDRRWVAAREGIELVFDDVVITMLYPVTSLDAAHDANDNSVVFRLTFGRFAALFLGDAPVAVEQAIVDRHGGGLESAVLKVGHHGSRTSTGEPLLRAARPRLALVSAGRNNRYGHPAPAVVRRLLTHEVRVLRTDEHGSITVRATRAGDVEVLAG
jgi:competence protein ComEC